MGRKPSLLEQRIREYSIPPWPGQAMYARIILYRIPDKAAARETFNDGGLIVMPDDMVDTKNWRAPRGVIVSAGLHAMDILRGNGLGLGDIVWMASHTQWCFEVDTKVKGDKVEKTAFYFMQAGDAVIAEDLYEKVQAGTMRAVCGKDGKHYWVVDDGAIPRFDPPSHPDEM